MVLCASFRATLLAARITYELPADNERALGKRRERERGKLHAHRQMLWEKVLPQTLMRPNVPGVKSFTGQ